jgi:hypothetical protein
MPQVWHDKCNYTAVKEQITLKFQKGFPKTSEVFVIIGDICLLLEDCQTLDEECSTCLSGQQECNVRYLLSLGSKLIARFRLVVV